MHHIERRNLWLQAFLDIDENIQKTIKKRIFHPFSVVKFECLDQFWFTMRFVLGGGVLAQRPIRDVLLKWVTSHGGGGVI